MKDVLRFTIYVRDMAEFCVVYEGAEALFVGALGLHAFHTAGYAVGPQDLARKTTALISGITSGLGVMAGAASQYITGAVLSVDGGFLTAMGLLPRSTPRSAGGCGE